MAMLTQQLEKSWSKIIKYEATVPANFGVNKKKNKNHLCFLSTKKKTLCFKKAAEVREALIFFQFLLEMLQQLCTRFLDSYTSIRISK